MTSYTIQGLTVVAIGRYGETTNLNADGEPCMNAADLRAFVNALHDQRCFLQGLIEDADRAGENYTGLTERAATIRDELLAQVKDDVVRCACGTICAGPLCESEPQPKSEMLRVGYIPADRRGTFNQLGQNPQGLALEGFLDLGCWASGMLDEDEAAGYLWAVPVEG